MTLSIYNHVLLDETNFSLYTRYENSISERGLKKYYSMKLIFVVASNGFATVVLKTCYIISGSVFISSRGEALRVLQRSNNARNFKLVIIIRYYGKNVLLS